MSLLIVAFFAATTGISAYAKDLSYAAGSEITVKSADVSFADNSVVLDQANEDMPNADSSLCADCGSHAHCIGILPVQGSGIQLTLKKSYSLTDQSVDQMSETSIIQPPTA